MAVEDKFPSKQEADTVNALLAAAIAIGYRVSVNDGEETVVERSTDVGVILDAMASTEMDVLSFHSPRGPFLGSITLVYGNGEDLVSDHTDNMFMSSLLKQAGL